jgi:hypothetical protein
LHVTTKIEGHPHDGLLKDKGYRGFPTLVFMDTEGKTLASPAGRSVIAFERCVFAIEAVDEVRERAEAGNREAQVELLLLEYDLAQLKGEAFDKRAEELRSTANEKQLSRIDQIQIDNQVEKLIGESFGEGSAAASEALMVIFEAGKRPSATSFYGPAFWIALGKHAHAQGDSDLLRRIVTGIRESSLTIKYLLAEATRFEKVAAGLDERDALFARQDGGEIGLEAKILLLEVRIRVVAIEVLESKLPAALVVATDAERDELLQGAVDLELEFLSGQFWGGGDAALIGPRLLELLEADGPAPSKDSALGAVWPLDSWLRTSKDSALLLRCASVIRKHAGQDPSAAKVAGDLEKAAAELGMRD